MAGPAMVTAVASGGQGLLAGMMDDGRLARDNGYAVGAIQGGLDRGSKELVEIRGNVARESTVKSVFHGDWCLERRREAEASPTSRYNGLQE